MGTLTLKPNGGSWYHLVIIDSDRKLVGQFGTGTAETMVCDNMPFGNYTVFLTSVVPVDSFKVKISKCKTTLEL